MNEEKFEEALGNVNDKHIEEAGREGKGQDAIKTGTNVDQEDRFKKTKRSLNIWRGIAIAACAILVVGIVITAVVTGFRAGSAKSSAYDVKEEMAYDAGDNYYYDEAAPAETNDAFSGSTEEAASTYGVADAAAGTGNLPASLENNKIIYRASLFMETEDFDAATQSIETLTKQSGGYFENADVSNYSGSYRTAFYTIRVPKENLDSFLEQAGQICTVKSINRSAEDVSENYYDTASRLETAKTKLARLQQLLAQAANMEDIIVLENEISNTESTIDSLTGSLKEYDSLVNYSTVDISLQEVYKTTGDATPRTFGQRIARSFKDGVGSFVTFLGNFVVWLAQSWIWLVLIAAVIVVVIVIIVKVKKKSDKNS